MSKTTPSAARSMKADALVNETSTPLISCGHQRASSNCSIGLGLAAVS